MKEELRHKFQAWYASEVERQLKEVSVHQVKVDVALSNIKGRSANSSWQAIEACPHFAINGFRKAGILDAVAAVRG